MKQLLFLFALLFSLGIFSQPPKNSPKQERKEKIKAQKIGFISNELNLSSKEAEVFWPVYNEYESKIEKLRIDRKKIHKKLKFMDELSDDEAYSLTEEVFEIDTKEGNVRKEYLGKFAKVLNKKKATKVFMAEVKFNRELLKKIKKGNNKGPHHDGPPHGSNR